MPDPHACALAQNNRIAIMLAAVPQVQHAGATAVHVLSHHVAGLEAGRGQNIYKVNDAADGYYILVEGSVTLYDVRDKDDPGEGESSPVHTYIVLLCTCPITCTSRDAFGTLRTPGDGDVQASM